MIENLKEKSRKLLKILNSYKIGVKSMKQCLQYKTLLDIMNA